MIGTLASSWMTGTWPTSAPVGGDALLDVNGVTITVGATVKLVGVVTAIDEADPHYQDITIALSHPNGNGPTVGSIVHAYPLQLVVGS